MCVHQCVSLPSSQRATTAVLNAQAPNGELIVGILEKLEKKKQRGKQTLWIDLSLQMSLTLLDILLSNVLSTITMRQWCLVGGTELLMVADQNEKFSIQALKHNESRTDISQFIYKMVEAHLCIWVVCT